jgi:hypothetical protein
MCPGHCLKAAETAAGAADLTWKQIGAQIGTTAQAAQQRYGPSA